MIRPLDSVCHYPNKRPRLEVKEGPFKNLPLEIVEKIISKNGITTPSYFVTICLVSKIFNKSADDLLIKKHNSPDFFYDLNGALELFSRNFFVKFLEKYSNKITCLTTQSLPQHFDVQTSVSFIEKLSNLKKLVIQNSSILGSSFTKSFENLEVLMLKRHAQIGYEELRDLSKKFPNVKELQLQTSYVKGFMFFDAIVRYFPNLRAISINPMPEDDERTDYEQYCLDWIREQGNVMPEIREFSGVEANFDDASLPFILKSFPNLESLNLVNNFSITFEVIPENSPKNDALKILDLYGCNVTEKGLKNIVSLFPSLEELNLPAGNLDGSSVEEIISSLKKISCLKHLTLCKLYQDKGLEHHLPGVKITYD